MIVQDVNKMSQDVQAGFRIVPDMADGNCPPEDEDITKNNTILPNDDPSEPAPATGPAPGPAPGPAHTTGPAPGPAPAPGSALVVRPSPSPPSHCQYCGAMKGQRTGMAGAETGGGGRDDQVTKTLEASLPADQALQLRHLVRRLRDERWHAMQAAQDDRDMALKVKSSLKATREDVKALNLALNKVRRAARSLHVTTTKDLRALADHFSRVVSALVSRVQQREQQHKRDTGADKLEDLVTEFKEKCELQLAKLSGQEMELARLSEENKQVSKDNEKQQIIFKSREQVSKQKITSLENELALLQKEREKLQRDLRTASRSLDKHQVAQQQSQNASDQLEESKLNLEKVRLNLENAIRERNLFKEKLNKAKEEHENNLKKIEANLRKARGDQEDKHKEKLEELEKQLGVEKAQHQETLAQYINDFRKNEGLQAEKFKQRQEKAKQKIKELEEELQRLTQTSHERETALKDRLEEMRASVKPDTKPKETTNENGVHEFKIEIERLNSLVAKECEERLELRQALEDARGELLHLKGVPAGIYRGGSFTARPFNSDVTASSDVIRERSFYKSRWTSEPSLLNPAATKKDLSPGQRSGVKKVLQTNYAHAVSTEDLLAETADRHLQHFLPPIPQAPRKSLDNTSGLEKDGIAAFHPHKEGFRIPKPMDYLRSSQQVDAKQKQQQQMVSRIFKPIAAATAAAAVASGTGNQRATLMPLPERGSHAQRTLAPVTSQVEPVQTGVRQMGRLTVRIPYSTEETIDSNPGINSPFVPHNSPVSNTPSEQFPNPPKDGVSMGNDVQQSNGMTLEVGGETGAVSVTNSDQGKIKTRKTTMDYDFSTSKGTEIAYGSRNRVPDSGDARRRVMQLLNEKDEKGKKSYMWGY